MFRDMLVKGNLFAMWAAARVSSFIAKKYDLERLAVFSKAMTNQKLRDAVVLYSREGAVFPLSLIPSNFKKNKVFVENIQLAAQDAVYNEME